MAGDQAVDLADKEIRADTNRISVVSVDLMASAHQVEQVEQVPKVLPPNQPKEPLGTLVQVVDLWVAKQSVKK